MVFLPTYYLIVYKKGMSPKYASHFLMRNEESRNLMTRNSSQGKKTRKTRNLPVLKSIFKAKIELLEGKKLPKFDI